MKICNAKNSGRFLFCTFRLLAIAVAGLLLASGPVHAELKAGAVAVDITPDWKGVIINGNLAELRRDEITDLLHARALVLENSGTTVALVIVDSCMLPRELIDPVKRQASEKTGIPVSNILIAATHTHSAPSAMGLHGADADERYVKMLPGRLVQAIEQAWKQREPAEAGWAVGRDENNVFCRRFRMKEGTAFNHPFSGTKNASAQMNPGHSNANRLDRTGPVDPAVTILSVRSRDGRPIALLGNYSTHYAGAPGISADYFGVFAEEIKKRLNAENVTPVFVGILSNGTSGDANCIDFLNADRQYDRFTVAQSVAGAAMEAHGRLVYQADPVLAMTETHLELAARLPSDEEVAEARAYMKTYEGRLPKTWPEIYAREQVYLSETPATRQLCLQAMRLGDGAVAAAPCEMYGITGLTLKKDSPFPITMVIGLANGYEGYLPPPDQFELGGYTTWRARVSCLETGAEPKIRNSLGQLLEKIGKSEKP